MANPAALQVAVAASQQFEELDGLKVGLMALAALVVACSPKSNSACVGIDKALEDVRNKKIGEVPMNLRDAHYPGSKELGHGKGYKYSHDYPYGRAIQQYLPDELKNARYYFPKNSGTEARIKERDQIRKNEWRFSCLMLQNSGIW